MTEDLADSVEAVSATGRCTRQLARIAGRSAKFLSNLRLESLCTAGIATRSTESPGATKTQKRLFRGKGPQCPFSFLFLVFFSIKAF